MTLTDPLFACLCINIGVGITGYHTHTQTRLIISALNKAILRFLLFAVVIGSSSNLMWMLIAIAITGTVEWVADLRHNQLSTPSYAYNLLASFARMATAFFIFGLPSAFPGFSPLIIAMLESVTAQNTALTNITADDLHGFLVNATGILIASFEANHLIAFLLVKADLLPTTSPDHCNNAHGQSDNRNDQCDLNNDNGHSQPLDNQKEMARGRIIGILERAIVFLLTVNDAISSLGLIIAAKALTRFKDLDKREFAEYVLIGTLLSLSAAVAIGLLLKDA